MEQAVSRALRDNLEKLQRNADELHQAIADTVAACASSKATNALPPMLRAQTAAASLAASLEVLTRFVSSALRPAQRSQIEEEIQGIAGLAEAAAALEESAASSPVPAVSGTKIHASSIPAVSTSAPEVEARREERQARVEQRAHPELEPAHPKIQASVAAPEKIAPEPAPAKPPIIDAREAAIDETAESLLYTPVEEKTGQFDVSRLPQEEQDLHRRANRVAKVSMQDIKMLRPQQVKAGLEHKDICARLRDDIAKAHREYERRFRPIMEHPVDYFYHWMVEILADGDPQALGEYPYASPVVHR